MRFRAMTIGHLRRLALLSVWRSRGCGPNAGGAQEITPSLPAAAPQTAAPAETLPAVPPADAAQAPIKVILDDNLVNFLDVPPIEIGGRILVPLREVFEALGATVNYDATTRTIAASRDNTQIKLTLDSTAATVDGQSRPLDVPAQARAGHTLVPLRFVSEALGAQVNWNAAQRTVNLIAAPLTTSTRPHPPASPRIAAATPGTLAPYLVPARASQSRSGCLSTLSRARCGA